MMRLPSTRREWVGPSALSYLSGRLRGALPQAGIEPRLRRSLAARSDRPYHGVAGNAPTAQPIPAWGNAPYAVAPDIQGLKARPISPSIPQIPFIEFNSIFVQKCAKFFLKRLLAVIELLRVDITAQRIQSRRPDGERAIASLPRELRQIGRLGLEPFGRGGFELFHQFRYVRRAGQTNGEMNVVRNTPYAIAFAFGVACDGGKIGVERGTHRSVKDRRAIFCAEDHMDQEKREGLWHREDYRSGFQPSFATDTGTWGFAPCWYKTAPTALNSPPKSAVTTSSPVTTDSPQKSAEGSTLYQPGATPQLTRQTGSQAPQARPIPAVAQPC